jgi:hypothetical protein
MDITYNETDEADYEELYYTALRYLEETKEFITHLQLKLELLYVNQHTEDK